MGLNSEFLRELIAIKRSGAFEGRRVAEIGAQQLADTFLTSPALADLYALFGCAPVDLGLPVGSENFANHAPASDGFWRSLGLDYVAIDLVGSNVIRLDLNRDAVPNDLRGSFDLVVNIGTTEHVANQDNAFRIIHDLTRPGGLMMHQVPAQGNMGHGLIHYDPKFFWHLCRENGYQPLPLLVAAGVPSEVPQSVLDSNLQFAGHNPITAEKRGLRDFWIIATLRKTDDRQFVTPLDLPA